MKKILFFLFFVLIGTSQVVAQNTSPYFETIEPFNQTTTYLQERETIKLFVDVFEEENLSHLEVQINNKNLNNYSFLFYPNQTTPHPSQNSTGISGSYNSKNQSWNIDLGSTISPLIVDQSTTEIMYIIKNNQNLTGSKNSTYDFYSDSTAPQIQSISPSDSQAFIGVNSTFTYGIDILEASKKKTVDTLKNAVFRYDFNNQTSIFNISIGQTPVQFPLLNVTYNYSNQYLSFEFSKNQTQSLINNSAVFYIQLKDEAGNTYGSVENLTSRQTPDDFKYINEYSFQEDNIKPQIVDSSSKDVSFLAENDVFKYSFQVNETNLDKVEFFITGDRSNYSFDLYPGQKDPLEYEGNTKGFVNATYNQTSQIFGLLFDTLTTTDLVERQNISIKVQVFDKADNKNLHVENLTLKRDNFAPQIDMMYPFKNNITLDPQENFTLVVNAFDKTNNLDTLKIKYDYNKTTYIEEFLVNSSNYNLKTQSWNIEFNQSTTQKFIDEEFMTFVVEITDNANNSYGSFSRSPQDATKTYTISRLTNTTNKTKEILSTQNTTIAFTSGFRVENIQNRSTGQIKVFENNPHFSTTLENEVLIIAEITAVVPKLATLSYPLSKLRGYEGLEFYVWNSTSWNICPTNQVTSTHLVCNTSSFSTWAITGVEVVNPPSSGGGGGGSSNDEEPEVFEFNINRISFDETVELQEGDQIELAFRGRTFDVEIEEVDDGVQFNVQGFEFSLEQGDTRRFDLTGNNQDDIEVQVEDIDSSTTQVRLQRIREETQVVETTTGESQSPEEEEDSESQINEEEPRGPNPNANENTQRNNRGNALTGYITQNIPTVAGALSGIVLITLIMGGAYIMRRRL